MIGILIIAHAPLASALRDCALHVYPECASGVQALDILPNASPDESLRQAKAALTKLNTSKVLMLSDVCGATPKTQRWHRNTFVGWRQFTDAVAQCLLST
jgi:PTS system ascorbate-specific IIA component